MIIYFYSVPTPNSYFLKAIASKGDGNAALVKMQGAHRIGPLSISVKKEEKT